TMPSSSSSACVASGRSSGIVAMTAARPLVSRCATTDWDNAVTAWRTAQQETNGRAAVIATMPELLPEATQAELLEDGIVPLVGLDDALLTIAACAAPVSPAPERAHGLRRTAPRDAQLHRTRNLTEHEAKLLLSHAGVPVPSGALVTSPGEARAAFDALGPNVAMKAVAADLLHKTELGAVRLGLTSHDAVRDAYIALAAISPTVRLEQMAPSTVAEIIVGIRHDPVIGFYLLVGSGGILTEVVGDSVVLILPTSSEAIRAALLALRSAVLLAGFRGRPAGDIDAAVAAIHALAVFAQDHADTLDELEINPLLVHAQGAGVTAVDAVLRVVEKADPPAPIDTRQEISS
ncbi:MAG: acetate--CoA ligase family protein, partial [Pseudomonadota bacterium]